MGRDTRALAKQQHMPNVKNQRMKPHTVATGVALLYLLACLCIQAAGFEGSWGGFLTFILAAPFSYLSLVISQYMGVKWLFVGLNALWWYALVRLFYFVKNKKSR